MKQVKKRIISGILSLLMILSSAGTALASERDTLESVIGTEIVDTTEVESKRLIKQPVEIESEVGQLAEGEEAELLAAASTGTTYAEMLARAEAIVNYTWTPSQQMTTWNGNLYKGRTYFAKGETVVGMPYTLFTSEVVGDSLLSLEQYKQKSSLNYSTTKYCVSAGANRTGPVYGSCCATFVSEVFGGRFMSGSNPVYDSVNGIKNSPYGVTGNVTVNNIQPGDALSIGNSHIIWVGEVTDTHLTIYEQTPPVARKVVVSKSSVNSQGYLVYGGQVYSVVTRSKELTQGCTCSEAYAGEYTCITSSLDLNIRSGHGSNYSVIGAIPSGARVYVTKASGTSSGDWAHVEYNGISGYASMQYLSKVTEAEREIMIRCWMSDTDMGEAEDSFIQGGFYYLCYRIFDGNTNELLDSFSDYSYTVTQTLYYPDGTVGNTYSYNNDNNWIALRCTTPGTYAFKVELTGDFTGTFEGGFTVEEDPLTINTSTSNVNLSIGGTESQEIQVATSGYYNGSYFLRWEKSNSNVTCSWGSWTEEGCPLTITALSAGTTDVTLYIMDSDTEEVLTSKVIHVTVANKEYRVSYHANGGSGVPSAQMKTHDSVLTLSGEVPERMGYTFLGWNTSSTATTALYEPEDSYIGNASVTLYAVWKGAEVIPSGVANSSYTVTIPFSNGYKYYKFVPAATGKYRFESTGTCDSRIYLYRADGTLIKWDDDSGENTNFLLTDVLTANTVYYVKARIYDTYIGEYTFRIKRVYDVNYDANGGNHAPSAQELEHGEYKVIPEQIPERNGYTFLGWNMSPTAVSALYEPSDSYTATASMTLYAVWQKVVVQKADISQARVTLLTEEYEYSGNLNKPEVIVNLDGRTLVKDTDYTVSYQNNRNVGTATVLIMGIGDFTGSVSKDYRIIKAMISVEDITLSNDSYVYDGSRKEPLVTVKIGDKTLVQDIDYTISYADNTEVGTARVSVEGKGNYTGTVSKAFTILSSSLESADVTLSETSYVYDGSRKEPLVTVKIGDKTLVQDIDYTISYADNTEVGTARVSVEGKGNYTGTVSKAFTILSSSLESADVTLSEISYVYDGSRKEPLVTVKLGGKTLVPGTDYTVNYANNTDAGISTVIVTGKENYTGTVSKAFTILSLSLESADVALSEISYVYDGSRKEPLATVKLGGKTLVPGTDYTVSYANNTEVGTARVSVEGKGNYTGTVSKTFTILSSSLESAEVTLSEINYVYDGSRKEPLVTVKIGDKTLVSGTDYTISYANNTEVGTAMVTISGKGNYGGTVSRTYTIIAASFETTRVTLDNTSYDYDGKMKTPSVTVMCGNNRLVKDIDYTVSYQNNKNIGTAIVVLVGKGNYAGTIVKTFTIKLDKGDTVTLDKYKYKVTGSSSVAFTGVTSTKTTKVSIPKTVKYGGKTFKVTSIASKALKGKTKVTEVKIGANVTTIGNSAFEGCKKLSKVTIGSSVTKIEDKAFKSCSALKSITIPGKVIKLGKQVFYGCKNLKTITMKSTKLKTVGKEAFKKINSKASIKVPKSKFSYYKKLLKNKGQGKKVKIVKY